MAEQIQAWIETVVHRNTVYIRFVCGASRWDYRAGDWIETPWQP
jgi:hypothetical protein